MSAAQRLGAFAAGLRWQRLEAGLCRRVKLHLLDALGVMCAGAAAPEAGRVREALRAGRGEGAATVVAAGWRAPAAGAAFANAFQGRIHTFDDTYEAGPIHPGTTVAAAALACAERSGADGPRLLEAFAAGWEIAVRVARAAGPEHYQAGFHGTGTCNAFGAGAAAARALGLEAEGIAAAIALAGQAAAGLRQYQLDGAMSDSALHRARAAQAGVESAGLAAAGLRGPAGILEGERGFLRVMSPAGAPELLTAGLGEDFVARQVSIKPYPSCRFTHGPIERLLALRREHALDAETVASVEIATFRQSVEVSHRPGPAGVSEAVLSHQFAAAWAIAYGAPTLASYTEAALADPVLMALCGRVAVVHDPDLERDYPARWPHRLTVRCRDGRTLRADSDFPPGGPQAPLGEGQVVDKFLALAGPACGREGAERVCGQVLRLEAVDDVAGLIGLLAKAPARPCGVPAAARAG
jgi:2-methylcitrate dehydratase PrpD